jgi:hypothetical protein
MKAGAYRPIAVLLLIISCCSPLTGLSAAAPAAAASLGRPTGVPILVVSGKIANTNDGSVARFDFNMLEHVGTVTLTTKTPWHDGVVEFEGVPMSALMQVVGAEGTEVVATALNDYRAALPISDFARYAVVLALKRDGKPMPIRDKGPLFIVYPFDSDPDLRTEQYYSRSVWQVKELIVR